MSENRFAALAVVHRAAGEVTANRDAQYYRRFECAVRTPTHDTEFIANLHHRWPDVVEKLNLRNRLEAARCHPNCSTDDARFRQGCVKLAVGAEFSLQAGGCFENTPFPFYVSKISFPTNIGHVLSKNNDALVTQHFIRERSRHRLNHSSRCSVVLRLGSKSRGCRVYVR